MRKSLLEALVEKPQRETSGSDTSARFDYQKGWAFCQMLRRHMEQADYLVAFEFHDDVVFLTPSAAPTRAEFFQVKTSSSASPRKLAGLLSRPKNSNSILGKMFLNFDGLLSEHELQVILVSNIAFEFAGNDISATELPTSLRTKIIEKLKDEISGFAEDQGNFAKGLKAIRDGGKISQHELEILEPVLQAGHAAAHRGWAPTREQLATILDTVEGLLHRLLVLPKLAEELEEAVPSRGGPKTKQVATLPNIKAKIDAAPKDLRAVYDDLAGRLKALGDDVSVHPQKHYIAFRRRRNFASVQIYNRKKVVRLYLNLDPDEVKVSGLAVRDVRQLGHFGTGDVEITIHTKKDVEMAGSLLKASYDAS
ncbi:dsDNA nuclease domain-containing protein [Bradyrhizobium sp. AZCC 2230]|uniref:dsDNA nuclease domain-containing protein n=1 Tax=Bradyrhizobium sp. AZCC 2230 TaxID=3117021 RepID=UPI002FF14E1B